MMMGGGRVGEGCWCLSWLCGCGLHTIGVTDLNYGSISIPDYISVLVGLSGDVAVGDIISVVSPIETFQPT
jgi:hypothetical protein